jgi:SAM-dependent methyltransferase
VTSTAQPAEAAYAFADDPARGATHHGSLVEILSSMLDRFTIWRLRPYVAKTSRCLEVAAGAGSVAAWLARHAGEVTATDTDVQHVAPLAATHPNLTVTPHDIETDPLEAGRYDLIHTRLLLAHLPRRRELVGKLAAALAPGGVLVIDEFQAAWDWCLMDAPDLLVAGRLFAVYQQALTSVLAASGNDIAWGRNAHRAMREHDLVDIDVEFWAKSWYGGQPGCQLPYLAAAQLRPKLIDAGMSAADIDAFRTLLEDPTLMIHANLAVSTCGRRPR